MTEREINGILAQARAMDIQREAFMRLRYGIVSPPPAEWARPEGYDGPCPKCGSLSCRGYYKPDGSHFLAF